jgi:hypothetical protein
LAWAMLSDLFAPGFICITLMRIIGLRLQDAARRGEKRIRCLDATGAVLML